MGTNEIAPAARQRPGADTEGKTSMPDQPTVRDPDTAIMRTARKAHICIACEQPIAPGTRYVEHVGMAEGPYASGWRYCLDCAREAGLLG